MKTVTIWVLFFAFFLLAGLVMAVVRSGFPPEVAPPWDRHDWLRWTVLSAILAAAAPFLMRFAWSL